MREIYADFNDFDADGSLALRCAGSQESIAHLSEPLIEGEEVWFSDGEMRAKGRVSRGTDGAWEGRAERWTFDE